MCTALYLTISSIALSYLMLFITSNSLAICVLGSSASASVLPTPAASSSPESLLAAYCVKLPGPISLEHLEFLCKVFENLFPKNETVSPVSLEYTPLYEDPWLEPDESSLLQMTG